ncbi:xylulokinase [soil metagenome]
MSVFVGCDLGTMGTKAAVVDAGGRILGQAYEEVTLHTPRPGWVEQDLADIERSAHRTLRAALDQAGRPPRVAGVAFSGQMSGIGGIDGAFEPATRFDSWLDSRCERYVEALAEHAERITTLAGCPPTYSHAPKIAWWMHERPDEFARIARFVVPGAYVASRLCGLGVVDAFIDRTYLHFSNLSDTASGRWSTELLERTGIPVGVLPRIVDPLDIVGEVTSSSAVATGLPAGTPVAAGAGDQAAAALGAGVVQPGQAFDSSGTASVFAVCTDAFVPDPASRTFMATHSAIAGRFLSVAFMNGGGLALRWFRDEIAPTVPAGGDPYARLDALAEAVEPGSGGLLWFPHFQGRVLPPLPSARGVWLGLTSGHGLAHLYRSQLEGIAYQYAAWARGIADLGGTELREARALGGGARSALWNQIKADVLGIDWVPTQRPESGVLGDAIIAAAATGHISDPAATALEWQATRPAVRPDAARHARYSELVDAFLVMERQLGPIFEQLPRGEP